MKHLFLGTLLAVSVLVLAMACATKPAPQPVASPVASPAAQPAATPVPSPEARPSPVALKDRPGVVVFEFENKSGAQTGGIGSDIAQALTEALLRGERLRPVERTELAKILQEQEFSASGLVREEDALKVGRIAGARFIMLGTISVVGDQIRLNARLLDVETAEIVKADSVFGPMKDIFQLEDGLARKLEGGVL